VSHPHGPPPEEVIRRRDLAGQQPEGRDVTPAVGTRGEPGRWRRRVEGAPVAGQRPRWADAAWSFLYGRDTRYARGGAPDAAAPQGAAPDAATPDAATPDPPPLEVVRAAARRARGGEEVPVEVHGPVMNAPVWTWEVPLYFFFGGVASGSSFVALACDTAGDERSAAIARRVTLAATLPCAPLLIGDLGRPLRFLNMLRIFKLRSPMSMGAWCLTAFSGAASAAVGADLIGRRREARLAGAATALLGTYLGSYTGVLLASTAVPVWARSRATLPPIFICTAAAGGAAANRLVLAAVGVPRGHPTRAALGTVETVAMASELALSALNERRLGRLGDALQRRTFTLAKWAVRGGLALRFTSRRPAAHHAASALYLIAALAFRVGWVEAGKASARDDEAVARMARR
jgi:formate-dependent nitrite reductase membrane component NrfD